MYVITRYVFSVMLMHQRLDRLLLGFTVAVLAGCAADTTERDTGVASDTLRWTPSALSRPDTFQLTWPDITDTTMVARRVWDSVRTRMFDGMPSAQEFVNVRSDEYRTAAAEYPTMPGWWFDREAMIVTNKGMFVSVTVGSHDFTGGAHPYGGVWAGTFRMADGSMMTLDDVLRGAWRGRLDSLGEIAFRAAREIADTTSLQDAGFFTTPFVEAERFALAQTWYPSVDGLEFYYNLYEVGPYVMGPTMITIPWTAIMDVLQPDMVAWIRRNAKR